VAIQSAFLEAAVGSVLCLDQGIYRLSDGLSLGVPGVAVRAPYGRAILDFSAQASDAPGLQLLADDVDLQGLEIRNTAGDGVRIMGGDGVRLRGVRVGWGRDAPPVAGARGIAVVQATNVTLEDVRVRGASGPGILLEGAAGVAVSRASIRNGPEGISIVDSVDVDVRDERIDLTPAR